MDFSAIMNLASSAAAGAGAASSASAAKDALQFDPVLYKPADVSSGQTQFLGQGENLGAVADLLKKVNAQDNAAYQARLFAANPSLAGSIANVSKKANDYAAGVIAPDVQAKLDRDSAYKALQGGYGGQGTEGSSPFADAQKLVNTSLYRLNEQSVMAPQAAQQAFDYSKALSPTNSDVAATLLSPAALLQRQDQQNMFNTQIANQQAQLDAQAKAAKGNIIMGTNTASAGGGGSPLGGI